MKRQDVLKIIIEEVRAHNYISVATMQATPVWHAIDGNVPLHLDMLGCMGSASSLGLGLALGSPKRKVVTIDGDGCVMMQLGTLVTIANAKASNFTLIVMNNGFYETSGNQKIPGADTADFVALAAAAGFKSSVRISNTDDLRARFVELVEQPGPTFVALDIDREEAAKVWPALSMKQQIQTTREIFLSQRS